MYTRHQLVTIMKAWAEANPDILAIWEGGSAATGRLDQYSDLDLEIVVEDDRVEPLFADLEAFLQAKFGIIRKHRVPEPAWHGMSQCFYQIDQAAPFVYLDVAVMKRNHPDKLMEEDRHGQAVVWFDRIHVYSQAPSSQESIVTRGKKLFNMIAQIDFLMMIEIEKGLARGHFIDVYPQYIGFVQRHLGVLLNLKYRPAKADFGIRYGRHDYGQEDVKLLESAMQAVGIEALRDRYAAVKKRYLELLDELTPIWK